MWLAIHAAPARFIGASAAPLHRLAQPHRALEVNRDELGEVELTFKFMPGRILTDRVETMLQAIASGQAAPSGQAVTPKQVQAAPFAVRVTLDDAKAARCRSNWALPTCFREPGSRGRILGGDCILPCGERCQAFVPAAELNCHICR